MANHVCTDPVNYRYRNSNINDLPYITNYSNNDFTNDSRDYNTKQLGYRHETMDMISDIVRQISLGWVNPGTSLSIF